MRRGLVVLVLLAGCESRYGAYFLIKGDAHFDQVELYFGSKIDSSGPGSGDKFASPTFGAQQGLVYDRTFEASDVGPVGPTTETTYYLPPTDENQQLGDYVAAVALQGDKPVGMAEYFGFDVPTGEVHEFQLDLTAWNAQEMERWGSSPGCVVWKHPRTDQGSLVAVVHKDDRDCDDMPRDADCNDLCNAQVATCAADQTFCSASGFCALGCSLNGLCNARMCLPASACSSGCATQPTLQQRLDCGAGTAADHIEIYADRSDTRAICMPRFLFDPGVPCMDPKIEAKTFNTTNTAYTYMIAPDTNMGGCALYMQASSATGFGDTEQHHLLISFAPAALGPRPTVVVGVQASQNVLGCNTMGDTYTVTYPTNRLYNCP